MTILKAVLTEFVKMFVADIRMTAAILLVVVVAAGLVALTTPPHYLAGAILAFGTMSVPVLFAWAFARRKAARDAAK